MAVGVSRQLFSGSTRFVLSNGGHIAGIVNPPGPKSWFLAADDNPAEADGWMSSAQRCASIVVGRLGE